MRRMLIIGVLCALGGGVGMAQQPASPAFEVASIKPNKNPPLQDSRWGYAGDRFLVRNIPMRRIIAMAYGEPRMFPLDRVLGGPSWLDSERYDVEAKAAEPDVSRASLRAMARLLLEERLALKLHVEQRNMPIYNLTKSGSADRQLKASNGQDCGSSPQSENRLPPCGFALPKPSATSITISGYWLTMDEITATLQSFVDRPLFNRTALDGRFSFTLTVPRGDADDSETLLMSRALQDQLGLRLTPTTGPVDVLVIDSVARPTPN